MPYQAQKSLLTVKDMLKMGRYLYNADRQEHYQHIKEDGLLTTLYLPQKETKRYLPSKTGKKFHEDDTFIRLVMGPFGSGKTTMCVQEIVKRATKMPYWSNGRRRSKWAIIRNTSGELYSTTLQTWLSWFGDLGDISSRQKPILTYEHCFNDGHGLVELQVLFIALDRPDDVRKLKSLELTGAYINEMSEIPQAVLSHLKARVNRYPSHSFCKTPYWTGIIADTNPPDTDHWIYKDFEEKSSESYKIFHQPQGLLLDDDNKWYQNPYCDNSEHLAHDYYTKLAENETEGFIKVYCLGQYGAVMTGKVVYSDYNDDLHSADDIKAIQGLPINLGVDYGLTPACVVTQFTPSGHLRALKEYTTDRMGVKSFFESVVIPSLKNDFPYCPIGYVDDDPSGSKSDEIFSELSCNGVLRGLGLNATPARTNDIATRINGVRFFLNRIVDKEPGFLLSRKGCPTLRKGFLKDYHYKRIKISNEERYQEIPNKNFASHPHDGLQYSALRFAPDVIQKEREPKIYQNMWNPVFQGL